ncbi:MAG: DUF1934 domain-containing protein [Ruminococcus sp.]|nr:DUF1934 domain-containing protein [Ruminococcus sp.]
MDEQIGELKIITVTDGERQTTKTSCKFKQIKGGYEIAFDDTVLRIENTCVQIERRGEMSYLMQIRQGIQTNCVMKTDYGEIEMSILGKELKCNLGNHGGGAVIGYISSMGAQSSSVRVSLFVKA